MEDTGLPEDDVACNVRLSDPEFPDAQRDAVYYVRALPAATPTSMAMICAVNAMRRASVWRKPCHAEAPTAYADDCLADAEERAWSSPIFVDYGVPPGS